MKPIAAGRTVQMRFPADISILGISKDHTEAATITPEAKPSSALLQQGGHLFLHKENESGTDQSASERNQQGRYYRSVHIH